MSKKFRGVGYNMSQPLLQKDKILIGFDENYEGMYLDEKAISLHSCVLGTTGSGKTVLAGGAVRQAIRNGWGVLYIDLKGDMGAYKQMRIAAHLCGRTKDIRVINPVAMIDKQGMFGSIGTCSYNPFISIDQSAPLTSAVLNASERTGQSNAFYEEVKDNVIKTDMSALLSTGKGWTPRDAWIIHENARALEQLMKQSKSRASNVTIQSWLNALEDSRRAIDHMKEVNGTKLFFSKFSADDGVSDMFNTTKSDISMRQVWMEQQICWAILPQMLLSDITRNLGKLMLSELLYLSGYIQTASELRRPLLIVIDEFENFLFKGVEGLFNKSRSAGIKMFVAFQTLKQIDAEHSTAYRDALMENMRNKIVLASEGPDTAKIIADLIGKDPERMSYRIGDVTVGEADQYRISPTDLTDMDDFEVVLRSKGKYNRGRLVAFPSDYELGVDIPDLHFTPTITNEGGIGLYEKYAGM